MYHRLYYRIPRIPRPRLLCNPILQREVRARWRRLPAFATVLAYASLLALAVGWRYADLHNIVWTPPANTLQPVAANGQVIPPPSAPAPFSNAVLLGRQLFSTLTLVQALGWMLLAPVLTATSIAGERERGTLNGLLLSGLTPQQIVRGKMLSAMAFIALLLLAPLPVAAVVFLLGGVSPAEYGAALLLHAATATLCAALGLCCSAWNHKPGVALGWALGIVAICCVVPPVSMVSPWFMASVVAEAQGSDLALPGMMLLALVYGGCALYLLNHAALALYKPLATPPPVQTVSQMPAFLAAPTAPEYPFPGATRADGASNGAVNDGALVMASHALPAAHPGGALRRLPLVSRLRFENPVLLREVRSRLQMREGAWGTESQNSLGCWATLGLFFAAFGLLVALGDPDIRRITWMTFTCLWLVAVAVAAPIMGASAFTREREQGMLQPLLLTLLSRRDIILGKLGGTLVTCAYFSLAVLPVLLPCVRPFGSNPDRAFDWHYSQFVLMPNGVTLGQALSVLLIVGATAWFCTAFAMCLSWLCRQTWVATAGTLAFLFLLMAGVPLYVGGLAPEMRFWHPLSALFAVNNRQATLGDALIFSTLLVGLTLAPLALIHTGLRRGDCEPDRV